MLARRLLSGKDYPFLFKGWKIVEPWREAGVAVAGLQNFEKRGR